MSEIRVRDREPCVTLRRVEPAGYTRCPRCQTLMPTARDERPPCLCTCDLGGGARMVPEGKTRLLACPSCHQGIDICTFDAVAGTADCAACGRVMPQPGTPTPGAFALHPTQWRVHLVQSASGLRFDATSDSPWAGVGLLIYPFLVAGEHAARGSSMYSSVGLSLLVLVAGVLPRVLSVRRLSIEDGRFACRNFLGLRSLASGKAGRFQVREQSALAGRTMYGVIADMGSDRAATLWADRSHEKASVLCACLNAAVFITTTIRPAPT
jgi:hypothetical protein